MSAMSLCSILGFPVIRGTTRAYHGMSAPRKHDKERLCTLTSPVGAQGLLGFSPPLTLFLTKVNQGHSAKSHPCVPGESCWPRAPWLPEGSLPVPLQPSPCVTPLGVTGVVSQQAGSHLPHHISLVIEPQRAPARESDLDLSLQSLQTPSVTLGKSPVSL